MGNLGAYQWITTAAKRVGGPTKLIALVAMGGYAVLRPTEGLLKKVYKYVKNSNDERHSAQNLPVHIALSDGESESGVKFVKGDQFRILEKIEGGVLIEKLGDKDNPYILSDEFVNSILSNTDT